MLESHSLFNYSVPHAFLQLLTREGSAPLSKACVPPVEQKSGARLGVTSELIFMVKV